jgi:hypothetical protein
VFNVIFFLNATSAYGHCKIDFLDFEATEVVPQDHNLPGMEYSRINVQDHILEFSVCDRNFQHETMQNFPPSTGNVNLRLEIFKISSQEHSIIMDNWWLVNSTLKQDPIK